MVYSNFVRSLALNNLVKQKFHIIYGFDKVLYQTIKDLCILVSHKKSFVTSITLCKTIDPWTGTIFNPRAKISTILTLDYKMKQHTKNPRPGSSRCRQEDLSNFAYRSLCDKITFP